MRDTPRGTGHGDMAGGSTLQLTFKKEVPKAFMNPLHQKPSAEAYLRYNANFGRARSERAKHAGQDLNLLFGSLRTSKLGECQALALS